MRHKIAFRRLGRPTAHRLALLRNQVSSLIHHGEIVTTLAKAKETRRMAEKMVTLAKMGSIHHKRQAQGYLYGEDTVEKASGGENLLVKGDVQLWTVWAPIFEKRKERAVQRRGDGALLARLSFCQEPYEEDPVKRRRNRLMRQKMRYLGAGVVDEPPSPPEKVLKERERWLASREEEERKEWTPRPRKPRAVW